MIVPERMGCLTIRRRPRRTSPHEIRRFIPCLYVIGVRRCAFRVAGGNTRLSTGNAHRLCLFPNPQAFIMPRWQIEKSNFTGSTGSIARSDAVMSAAIRQPGLLSVVNRKHCPTRITCVSSGTINWPGRTFDHTPRSTRSCAHHPAQKQVQPLAGAAGRRPREEIRDAGLRPLRARRSASRSSARARVENDCRPRRHPPRLRRRPSAKKPSIEPLCVDHLVKDPHQRREVGAVGPAMHQVIEALAIARRIELADERRRRRPHHRQHAVDRIQHALHAAERQRRGDERHHLAIVGALEAVHDPHRIGDRRARR